jgi:hypothetical protein
MMEALRSSGTSLLTRTTRRNIPEDGILHSNRRENLKSYNFNCNNMNVILTRLTPLASEHQRQGVIILFAELWMLLV